MYDSEEKRRKKAQREKAFFRWIAVHFPLLAVFQSANVPNESTNQLTTEHVQFIQQF